MAFNPIRALMLAATIALAPAAAFAECGIASVYWEGARTANGEHFAPDGISAAHKSLPFGSRVTVRNQRTGRSILVRINDRGPFVAGRIIDLSRGAARRFGMDGLAHVCLEVVAYGGKGERAITPHREARQGKHHARHKATRKRRHHS